MREGHGKEVFALLTKRPSRAEMSSSERLQSSSPEIWGPPTWTSLHYLAEGYPKNPSSPVRKHCEAFLNALPWMLPCESCGFHFRKFLFAYPGGVKKITSCRDALRCFLVEAHDDVSAHTRPDAPPWSPEKAAEFYASGVRGPPPLPGEWFGPSHLVRSSKKEDGEPKCSCSPPGSPR
jgi:hypothetical protein